MIFLSAKEVSMVKSASDGPAQDPSGGGRRQGDRRQADLPYDGPDRRRGERRSGIDRRATPRDDAIDDPA
jgi:hypothetical protein